MLGGPLRAGSGDDRPPGVVSPPAGMTPSPSETGLSGLDSDQKQAQMVESWKAFKRVFQEGVALFSQKPKKGIAYMQASSCGAAGWGLHQEAVLLRGSVAAICFLLIKHAAH